ncbi:MAG: type IV pilus modification protein PilV [Deltaproteobacteria bacterium]|nr:type IV pilus modification protein PilV [Deltaproteobacteria bacterium]
MRIEMSKSTQTNQHGFTLVEVLVALVILSIGLLGVAGMQISGMKGNHNAFLRSQAQQYAYEMLDMMRANRTAATNGDYNLALTGAVPAVPVPDSVAAQDIREWLRGVTGTQNSSSALPGGQGGIAVAANVDGTWTVTITVQWVEGRLADDTTPSVVVVSKL